MRTSSRMGLASIGAVLAVACSAGAAAATRPTTEFVPPPDGLSMRSWGTGSGDIPGAGYARLLRSSDAVKLITGHLVVTFRTPTRMSR
jgi:hypothetical protein